MLRPDTPTKTESCNQPRARQRMKAATGRDRRHALSINWRLFKIERYDMWTRTQHGIVHASTPQAVHLLTRRKPRQSPYFFRPPTPPSPAVPLVQTSLSLCTTSNCRARVAQSSHAVKLHVGRGGLQIWKLPSTTEGAYQHNSKSTKTTAKTDPRSARRVKD